MYAAGRKWAGRWAGQFMAALVLAGCAATAPSAVDPSLIQTTAPGSNSDRPPFFVTWRNGISGLTAKPSLDPSSRMPEYPSVAVRDQMTGITYLDVCITSEGKLVDVKVSKSSGHDVLDEAAVDWAKGAKYKPAMFNDEAFAVCGYAVQYEWVLRQPGR